MRRGIRMKTPSLEALWDSTRPSEASFDPDHLKNLPGAVKRYLVHAIAPGTPLASAVRLRMHGQIRLKGWYPFEAEELIRWDRGMIWRATVRVHGMPVRGSDHMLDGEGSMRWRLFGMIPVVKASGEDITRSTVGRLAAEVVWLPSVLQSDIVSWTSSDPTRLSVTLPVQGHAVPLAFEVDKGGRLVAVRLQRWGNPGGGAFHLADFGAVIEGEQTFAGYTIPTRLRVGWHFKRGAFEGEGEFFRVRIDAATYR